MNLATTKQPTLTVDQVMDEDPCYERDHVEQLWAGRDALTTPKPKQPEAP